LNISAVAAISAGTMTRILLFAAIAVLLLIAAPLEAACYADFKAKQDNPLRLQYGVIELSDAACGDQRAARAEIEARIGRDGWHLLNVMSVFGPEGLQQRKRRAGDFFLRY
jgi:hypothetical protein